MNKKLIVICLFMVISCNNMHGMVRSILKSKAVDKTISIASAGGFIGCLGSTVSVIGSDQTLLDCATDVVVSTTACSVIPALLAAPMYVGLQAFHESSCDADRVVRFGHELQQNTLKDLKTVTWQPENKKAVNNLVRAHWSLHRWNTDYKDLKAIEGGFDIGAAPCVGVPVCAMFMYQYYNLEMFATGMSLNYLLATAALVQQKLRSQKVERAIKNCTSFDDKVISPEFIKKHEAMVARVHDQFQPIHENYNNHTNWAAAQIEQKGEFYYPNINEHIESFDKVMIAELENFKV